ncbi:hypothetical protein CR513_36174, partial [Mucuna pruriens]
MLASLEDQCFPFSARLGFYCTNNMAKYEAYAAGVLMAIEHQAKRLNVFNDSTLVIYQLREEWETRDSKLIPYHNYVMDMSEYFDRITFHYIQRDKNQMADALATLVPQHQRIPTKRHLPIGNGKRTLRRLAVGSFLSGPFLYKRSTNLTLLRCMDDQEVKEIIEEAHEGIFDTHTNGHTLA